MRPDSAPTPASDETLVADYVLQNMPAAARLEFESRIVLEPQLRSKVDDYRADLERLKTTLPAARPAEVSWAAVDVALQRHNTLNGIDAAKPADEPSAPAGCTNSDP